MDLPQTRLEPVLLKNAAARGAQISFSTEYRAHVQDEDGVTTTVHDRATGRDYTIRSQYLVGADGARSSVAEHLGLPFAGHTARAGTLYTLFRADLTQYVAHRPSILYWLMTQGTAFGEIGMGLLRTVRPWDEWIAGWGFDMSAGEPDTDPESVTARIRDMVGVPDLEITIHESSPWYVNQSHATAYSSGRVLCGGDAVHRHPPSGGLGSNTSVGDAFNLAWKLAYVVKGHAPARLLETYGDERVPVGEQVVARANASRHSFAALRDAISAPGAADPVGAAVAKVSDPGPAGVAARRALRAAIELRNYEFNAEGVELNQRYTSQAVLADTAAPEIWARDRELYAQATTRPGAKIPHAWLVDSSGRRVSTLDVTGKGCFTLVTGLAGGPWAEAVEALGLVYLRLVVVDAAATKDLYGTWASLREIEEDGALLIRPDGFVAARWHSGRSTPEDAGSALADALSRVLCA
jgi:2,4-dichlorophenol 6-monooxygenase